MESQPKGRSEKEKSQYGQGEITSLLPRLFLWKLFRCSDDGVNLIHRYTGRYGCAD